jgi:hypothetical protein
MKKRSLRYFETIVASRENVQPASESGASHDVSQRYVRARCAAQVSGAVVWQTHKAHKEQVQAVE